MISLMVGRARRDWRRMNGKVQLFNDEPIHGPYLKEWREHWLRRVLTTQTTLRKDAPEHMRSITLIRAEELKEIRRIWVQEKHEFDDSLPRIYEDCTGEPYPKDRADLSALGPEEWAVLQEVCEDDPLTAELVGHLLSTEQEHRTMSRRVGIYKALEDTLRDRGFTSKEEALEEARRRAGQQATLRSGQLDDQLNLLRDVQKDGLTP